MRLMPNVGEVENQLAAVVAQGVRIRRGIVAIRENAIGDSNDETFPRFDHHARCVHTGCEVRKWPGRHHVVPRADRRIPERAPPASHRILPVRVRISHAPNGIGENIHATVLAFDLREHARNIVFPRVIGGNGNALPAARADLVRGVVDGARRIVRGFAPPRRVRPVAYTVAPASPSASAIPRPAPRLAPATTATFPSSGFIRSSVLAVPTLAPILNADSVTITKLLFRNRQEAWPHDRAKSAMRTFLPLRSA